MKWMGCGAVLLALIGCGQNAALEKQPTDEVLSTAVSELTKQTLTPPIESEHPYKNDLVQRWTVKTPGCATFFRIHFTSVDVEEGYDFVRLVDKDGKKVKSYTGFFSGWSPQLPGTEATIELITDSANTSEGFKVDAIEYTADQGNGTWTTTMLSPADVVSTAHPYVDGTTKNWTVKGPTGTTAMRLHFKNFETEARYDIVSLFTAEMQQIATYTGALGDFISAEVPGDTVVVRLSADYSVPGNGFDIVGYEALMPGGPGTCATPSGCLVATPSKHDFGNVKVGCDATKEVAVTNTCAMPVQFEKATLPTGEFSLAVVPPASFSLAAGASMSLKVNYAPTDLGTDKGALELSATESGKAIQYKVSLEGAGDPVGANHDEFTQQASSKADILFVIDNSGSMADEQAALAQNFASFISYAKGTGVDFHLAVTTTDVDSPAQSGNFVSGVGHPDKVLTSATADLESQFKKKVNVGINGSATEMCLEAGYRALSAPLLTGGNANFLRSDASLAVVCISDEDEQSPQSVPFYEGALLNVKGNMANQVSYNVIGSWAPCQQSPFSSMARYEDMVTSMKGVRESICTPDWATALKNIGKSSAGFRTQFVLTSTPALSQPVTVKVDGANVPAISANGETVWTVDAATKTLTFTAKFAPTAGKKITVDYAAACGAP